MGAGFRAVIGTSFADIFSGNSAKSGLLLVRLKPEEVEGLFSRAAEGALTVTIDWGTATDGYAVTLGASP